MSRIFTGKAISKGVSMPTDMWAWLESRREMIGIPISRYVQDAIEEKIERDAKLPVSSLTRVRSTREEKSDALLPELP